MPVDFHDVSLPAGAIVGLIGESGSGISELLRLATASDRNIVAINHTLATQDAFERFKSIAEMHRLRQSGSTILVASHELNLLELLADEVWWIDAGDLKMKGDPKLTISAYREHVASKVREWGGIVPYGLAPSFRHGDGRAEILSIETLGGDGNPTIVWKSGESVSVRAVVRFHEAVEQPQLGLMIRTRIGFEVYGTNTFLEGIEIGPKNPGDTVTIEFSFHCDLCPYAYTITMASHDPDGTAHDWLDDAIAVTVVDGRYTAGVANLRAKVTVK